MSTNAIYIYIYITPTVSLIIVLSCAARLFIKYEPDDGMTNAKPAMWALNHANSVK